MKLYTTVRSPAGECWTIYYPDTEIELDTGEAPYMQCRDEIVNYALGCIVAMSSEYGVTPYVPIECMREYVTAIDVWLEKQDG